MAGKPETKEWSAWEDRQPGPGRGPTLHVTGEVKISNTNQKPRLNEASPQGINPLILILDLKIDSEGVGIEPVNPWAMAKFEKPVTKGQYSDVEIRSDGQTIANCKVKVVQ